jgi:hypothetical protein
MMDTRTDMEEAARNLVAERDALTAENARLRGELRAEIDARVLEVSKATTDLARVTGERDGLVKAARDAYVRFMEWCAALDGPEVTCWEASHRADEAMGWLIQQIAAVEACAAIAACAPP